MLSFFTGQGSLMSFSSFSVKVFFVRVKLFHWFFFLFSFQIIRIRISRSSRSQGHTDDSVVGLVSGRGGEPEGVEGPAGEEEEKEKRTR